MHPAYSVIFFTTASGAGFGILAILGLLAVAGALPPDFWLGVVSLGLAFGLIVGGLLSSTKHLGRPERAWRAFSQWRSSWLAREGVAAVATFVPAGLFSFGWVVLGLTNGWVAAMGLATAICAAIAVSSTAMIYASLIPIAQWHSRFTLPGYLLYSLTSGLVLLNAILHVLGLRSGILLAAGILFTLISLGWKIATWRHNDTSPSPVTINSATGLAGGSVRSVEWPHTEENYLMKEMGFKVARNHRDRLRAVALLAAFALPAALLVIALMIGGAFATLLSLVAAASQILGLLVERWLFFAEAKHTVTLYYGR